MSASRRQLLGALIVLTAAACFGTLGPLSRLSFERGMEPIGFVAWRSGVGALLIGALVAVSVRRGLDLAPLRSLSREARLAVATAALAGIVLNLAIFIAFDRITVALALLGFYTFPIWVTIASGVLHGERLDRPRIAALLLAISGIALVLLAQLGPGATLRFDALGFALALTAAVSQTVYILSVRTAFKSLPTEQLTALVLSSAAIAYLAIALATGGLASVLLPFSVPDLWPLVLLAGLVGAAVPTLLFLVGIRWIGGIRTAILAMFEPVVGVVLAALLLSEGIGPLQLLGGAIVLIAGAVLQASRDDPERAPGAGPDAVARLPAPG